MDNGFSNFVNNKLKLSLFLHDISENNDLFGIKIANELLINIMSFLLCEYTYICKRVCRTWFNNLKSNLPKKILTQVPKKICYSESYEINFVPKK
jgi:hypothetical protein